MKVHNLLETLGNIIEEEDGFEREESLSLKRYCTYTYWEKY